MSVPKEPRQLMINLMYLVLTAMLALNVSAEILNSFNIVNKWINESSGILQTKNDGVLFAIQKAAAADNRDKTRHILADAEKAKLLSDEFVRYVEDLKVQVKDLAGGPDKQDSAKLKIAEEMEKTSRFFLREGHGDELYNKIQEVQSGLTAFTSAYPKIQVSFGAGELPSNAENKSWAEYYFDRVPAVAVITILSKLQQDARSAENSIMEELYKAIYGEDDKVTGMTAKVAAPTSYLKAGTAYTADIYIGAIAGSMQTKMYIGNFTDAVQKDPKDPTGESFRTIEGNQMPLKNAREINVANGIGRINEIAGIGVHKYQGVIQVKHPSEDNTFKYYPFEFNYEAFETGKAVVSATAMNVLYVGVDNPVKISVPGYVSDKVTATGCNIKKINGEEYSAKPTEPGLQNISVTVNTNEGVKTYANEFRVRRIPDPYIYLSTSKGGTLRLSEFAATDKLVAKNPEFVFQIPYKILGYEMVYYPAKTNGVSDASNSDELSKMMKDIQKRAKAGDVIMLSNVRVLLPDGTIRSVTTSFKLI